MEARHTLDRLYNNPPSPNVQAFPDVCWAPLIRCLKISGLFFEAYHFPDAMKKLSQRLVKENLQDSLTMTEAEKQDTESDECKDNFVPILLRYPSGIMEDQQLVDFLDHGKGSTQPAREDDEDDDELVNTVKSSTGKASSNTGKSSTNTGNTHNSKLLCILNCFRGGRFYAVLITLIFWANLIRCFLYLSSSIVNLVLTWNACMIFLKISLNSSILLVSCWKRSYFSAFFVNWRLLFEDLTSRRLGLHGVANATNMKLVLGIFWMAAATNIAFMLYIVISGNDIAGIGKFFDITNGSKVLSGVISVVLMTYGTCGWMIPVIFIIVICRHITAHFLHFRDVFKLHVEAAEGHFPTHFRELRERHLVMCNLTIMIDKYVNIVLAVVYSLNITVACFLLHEIIADHFEPHHAGFVCGLVASVFNVLVLTYFASNVNISMHSVMYEIQKLQTNSINLDQQTQLNLFMSQLSDPDLGLTVLGMIVVRKQLILTLLGLYLTYAIVLLQFQ